MIRNIQILFTILILCSCHRHTNQEPTVKKYSQYRTNPRCITIDPGHGGRDPGTMTRKGSKLFEKNVSLDVALGVQKILEKNGFKVVMTRTNDTFIPLPKRVEIAQKNNAGLFVSIHFNWASNPKAQGVEVYYYQSKKNLQRTTESQELGKFLLKNITNICHTKSRGVQHGDFHVIRETKIPAVLIEGGFFSNAADAKRLVSKAYRQQLSSAIAQGIIEYVQKSCPRRELNARPVA